MSLTYSTKIRRIIEKIFDETAEIYIQSFPGIRDSELLSSIEMSMLLSVELNEELGLSSKIGKENAVIMPLIKSQLYSDLFLKMSSRKKLKGLSAKEKIAFENIKSINDYEQMTKLLYNDMYMINALLITLIFEQMSAYDKIIIYKCISDEEYNKLCILNPLFKEEYEKYNVEITEELIIRQIKKWNKSFPNCGNIGLSQTIDFLFDLYETTGESNFIEKVYENFRNKSPNRVLKENDEESLVLSFDDGEILLSKCDLKFMLGEYLDDYEENKVHKLEYKKDK